MNSNQKSNLDSYKDQVAYSCLLKNELLGADIEDVKDHQMDGQKTALIPKETKNFFQVHLFSFLILIMPWDLNRHKESFLKKFSILVLVYNFPVIAS